MRHLIRLLGIGFLILVLFAAWPRSAQAAPDPGLRLSQRPINVAQEVITATTSLSVSLNDPTTSVRPGGFRSFIPLIQSARSATQESNAERIAEPFTYTVKLNETLQLLSLDFGRDFTLMGCAVVPEQSDPNVLYPGQILQVPAATSACYYAQANEALSHVADLYGVTVADLLATPYNHLLSAQMALRAGQRVLIERPARLPERKPADPKPAPAPTATPSVQWDGQRYYGFGDFVWPTKGIISQNYNPGHRALDIAAVEGTPIIAADSGRVYVSGWSPYGYGNRIVLDHGNDYLTLYAHLSKILVKDGDFVRRGQVIGLVGSTGHSTGPHLHFEIRDAGILSDPLDYFPKPEP